MCLGYGVQDFIIQVLANTIHRDKYRKAMYVVFLVLFFSYNLVGYSCFAIVNRVPITEDPQTVEEYFPREGWEVRLIEAAFALHMLTACPEYTLILWYCLPYLANASCRSAESRRGPASPAARCSSTSSTTGSATCSTPAGSRSRPSSRSTAP